MPHHAKRSDEFFCNGCVTKTRRVRFAALTSSNHESRVRIDNRESAIDTSPDLLVIGMGSGGFGAALAAARLGLRVVAVEKADVLGGNAVRSGVSCWEPGAGGTGIPFDLYRRLKRIPNAVAIYSMGRHCARTEPGQPMYPGGEQLIDRSKRYIDSLLRCGSPTLRWDLDYAKKHWHGVPFEPDAMARVQEEMLLETGRVTLLKNTAFTRVEHGAGRVTRVTLSSGETIVARTVVDGTADALVAIAMGCPTMAGQESRAEFDEPDAPDQRNDIINAVSLIYVVRRKDVPGVDPLPEGVASSCWWRASFPVAAINHAPSGTLFVNPLPTMEGHEFLAMGPENAYAECKRRVLSHWHHSQTTFPEFQSYELASISPALGVRETRRVIGEYVLTQRDLLAGISGQKHDDIVCLSDHSMDTHGQGNRRGGHGELREPYGVPLRCLVPKGYRNFLVACRGASFTSIAASSCRLSRTMIQLGQAAGTAAALAVRSNADAALVNPLDLRAMLREQHVQLEWPMDAAMRTHLENENG